jgi:anti-anti-sigma factor
MLEVQVTARGQIDLITTAGRLDANGGVVLERLLAARGELRDTVLDLGEVAYLSSAGISTLLTLHKGCAGRGRTLVLAGLRPLVAQVLELTGMLPLLTTAATAAEAIALLEHRAAQRETEEVTLSSSRAWRLQRSGRDEGRIELWGGEPERTGSPQRVNLAELGLAFGFGGLGSSAEEAAAAEGVMLATGGVVAVGDGGGPADFLAPRQPADGEVFVAAAATLAGTPALAATPSGGASITLAQLCEDCLELGARGAAPPVPLGLVASASLVALDRAGCPLAGTPHPASRPAAAAPQGGRVLLVGVVARSDGDARPPARLAPFLAPETPGSAAHADLVWHVHALAGAPGGDPPVTAAELGTVLAEVGRGQVRDVWHLGGATVLDDLRVWLLPARDVLPGAAGRALVNVEGDEEFREEWETIVRRIYDDASRVELVPLVGGYTSRTYRVASFDRAGRQQLPTVLKVAPTAVTAREEHAYREYVEKFILNNSTTILGGATCGEWRGLRYNFLGVTGGESRLTWLEELYGTRPIGEVLDLLERVVTDILKPWYGQPRLETIHPFRDQAPSVALFPAIVPDGERLLGLSSDVATMPCPELGVTLPNPFHFLAHGYPARHGRQYTWYTSTLHGDLNLKNILVDERKNLYVIDFSETRTGNAVIDFARIEPIVALELTRIASDADLRALAEFLAGIARVRTLAETPPFVYRGDDPAVIKAHRTICRLRHWADTVTLFESSLVPYLVSLLEWTYPIVSYRSAQPMTKRAAVISCALIVEQILSIEESARQAGTAG